jgi:4-hydroxythreonine-4-phosphate dehydrogenase
MTQKASVRIAISMGDPSGIGPEVVAKALLRRPAGVVPYVFGDAGVFERAQRKAGLGLPKVEPGEPLPPRGALVCITRLPPAAVRPGQPSPAGGRAQLQYLEAALECVGTGRAIALCTGPVSKAQIRTVVPDFQGHTEWLAERTGVARTVMMLAGKRLRVALVTNHLALAQVPRALTAERLLETIVIANRALKDDFGLRRPRIAVLGLNPHAGEEGSFGDEEARLVVPALEGARKAGIAAEGPFSADGLFPRAVARGFAAVVALYHDQGLVAAKLHDALTGEPAVNVTLGLPIVRTSPDHGVAYDIAGKGKADARSMREALRLAAQLVIARRHGAPQRRSDGTLARSEPPAGKSSSGPRRSGSRPGRRTAPRRSSRRARRS